MSDRSKIRICLATILLLALGYARDACAQYKQSASSWSGPGYVRATKLTGDSIQSAINQSRKVGGICYIPGGTYLVNKTIVIDHAGPAFKAEGAGMGIEAGWDEKGSVTLKWVGPVGGEMIRWHGLGGCLSRVSLHAGDTNKAAKGIVFYNRKEAGASQNRLEDVRVQGFTDVGIQAGENSDDWNAADFSFQRCLIESCGTGFRISHYQGLNYDFYSCHFNGNGIALHPLHGGNIRVYGGASAGNDTWLKLGDAGINTIPGATVFGHRMEANGRAGGKKFATLVDASEGSGRVTLNAMAVGGGNNDATHVYEGNPLIDAGTSAVIKLVDSVCTYDRPGPIVVKNGGTVTILNSVGFER